jgi:hypothetical protein
MLQGFSQQSHRVQIIAEGVRLAMAQGFGITLVTVLAKQIGEEPQTAKGELDHGHECLCCFRHRILDDESKRSYIAISALVVTRPVLVIAIR